MKLKEFLSELTGSTNVVIVECHSDKESDECAKYYFPDIHSYIHFFGKRWDIGVALTPYFEMEDKYKEIGEYEICCIELTESYEQSSYIAVTVVNN